MSIAPLFGPYGKAAVEVVDVFTPLIYVQKRGREGPHRNSSMS